MEFIQKVRALFLGDFHRVLYSARKCDFNKLLDDFFPLLFFGIVPRLFLSSLPKRSCRIRSRNSRRRQRNGRFHFLNVAFQNFSKNLLFVRSWLVFFCKLLFLFGKLLFQHPNLVFGGGKLFFLYVNHKNWGKLKYVPLPQYSIMRNMSKRTLWGLFLAIFLLGAFLRFWWIRDIPVGLYIDEAMNGNNALEALQTRNFKLFYPENNGREGLFINLQALALSLLGREPWVLRSVSAVIGTLTILGIFLFCLEIFTKEHFLERTKKLKEDGTFHAMYRLHDSQIIALLAAFFLATSYWHLNFSRIGFRAIFVPLLTTFGFYFLLRGLRRGGIFDLTLGGLITGLGFHTYIAFRVVPGIAAIPILWYLRVWWKNRKILLPEGGPKKPCIPCSIVLFAIMAVVIALPIGLYFFDNPQDFSGRSGQ